MQSGWHVVWSLVRPWIEDPGVIEPWVRLPHCLKGQHSRDKFWLERICALFRSLAAWGEDRLLSKTQLCGFCPAQGFLKGFSVIGKGSAVSKTFDHVSLDGASHKCYLSAHGLCEGVRFLLLWGRTLLFLQRKARSTDKQREVSKIIWMTWQKKNILLKKIVRLIKKPRWLQTGSLASVAWESFVSLKASDLSATDTRTQVSK